jgi:hypothetical protein
MKSPRPAQRGEGGAKRRVRGNACRMAPLIRPSATFSPRGGEKALKS